MANAQLQLKASLTAFVLFALSSALLLLLARGLGNIAAALPLPRALPSFAPMQTVGLLFDLRPVAVLAAGILLAAGIVLILRNGFLDRAVQMLASMLVLVLASFLGIVVGFTGYLAIQVRHLDLPAAALPLLLCFAAALVASFVRMDSLRGPLLARYALALVLIVAAPMLLLYSA